MADDIALSSAQRTTLISLQQIDRDSSVAQRRLSFGQRIVDVTDGATEFFQARSLGERSSVFAQANERVDQGISALQTQLTGTTAARNFLNQALGLLQAVEAAGTGTGSLQALEALDGAFEEVFRQLHLVVSTDTQYGGENLLTSTTNSLTVRFSDDDDSNLAVAGKNLFSVGVRTAAAGNLFSVYFLTHSTTGAFQIRYSVFNQAAGTGTPPVPPAVELINSFTVLGEDDVTTAEIASIGHLRGHINNALGQLEQVERFFGNNIAILQTRLEFGIDYRDTLQIGRDKIVIADVNEEAAILTTLRTRNQIGIGALASNAESEQQLLRLLQ